MNTKIVIIDVGSRPEGYTEVMILSVLFFFDVLPFFYMFHKEGWNVCQIRQLSRRIHQNDDPFSF